MIYYELELGQEVKASQNLYCLTDCIQNLDNDDELLTDHMINSKEIPLPIDTKGKVVYTSFNKFNELNIIFEFENGYVLELQNLDAEDDSDFLEII